MKLFLTLIIKEKYTDIISVLVVPYIDRDYDKTLYDCSEYPPIETIPKMLAIIKRNEYMVNKSDASKPTFYRHSQP